MAVGYSTAVKATGICCRKIQKIQKSENIVQNPTRHKAMCIPVCFAGKLYVLQDLTVLFILWELPKTGPSIGKHFFLTVKIRKQNSGCKTELRGFPPRPTTCCAPS